MRKKTIAILYILALLFLVLAIISIFVANATSSQNCPNVGSCYNNSSSISSQGVAFIILFLVLFFVAIVLGMIAWIGALVKQGKQDQWSWFVCTLFFGGLALLIYLIAVPERSPQLPVPGDGQIYQRRPPMSKRGIAICYTTGLIVGIIVTIFFVGNLIDFGNVQSIYHLCQSGNAPAGTDCSPDGPTQRLGPDQIAMAIAIFFMITTSVLGMISWIGTLVNLSRMQAWTWFVLTFFFGGIMIFIYLVGGPQPLSARQLPLMQQGSGISPYPAFSASSSQVYQPSSVAARDILQQRYARGEIDSATFQQMRALLEE
jgi:hypothetical protein